MALGTLVGAGFVRIDADTKPAEKAIKAFGALGAQALTTALLPASAAVGAGVLAIGNAFAAAQVGALAFGAAAKTQFSSIQAASTQFQAVQKAQLQLSAAQATAQKAASKDGLAYEKALTDAAEKHRQAQALASTGGKAYADAQKQAAKAAAYAQSLATTGGKAYADALKQQNAAQKNVSKAQEVLNQQLAQMPKATQTTARAFFDLQTNFQKWGDSLAGDTMPIFTRGIQFLESLLPKLTPIVKDVSHVVSGFMDTLGQGRAGAVFTQFGKNMKDLAGGSLSDFLFSVKNIAVGFVGILNAFAPFSVHMTTGLAQLTGKFADFGTNLSGSKGFGKFTEYLRQAGPQLVKTIGALANALKNAATGIGPLAETGVGTLSLVAKLANVIPVPVLQQLVNAFFAVNAVLKLYALYSAGAAAYTWAFTTSITTSTGAVYASRAAMVLQNIQLVLMRVYFAAYGAVSRVVTAAQWLWTAATSASTLAMLRSTAAMVASRVASVAYVVAANAVRIATVTWTAVNWLLTASFLANPITWVIVGIVALIAAIVLVATKTTWFQTAWKYTWNFIKTVTLWVWDNVLKPVFKAIWDAIQAVGKAAMWLWDNAIKPAWNAIQTAANFLWNDVLKPVFRFIIDAWLTVAGGIVEGAAKAFGWVPGIGPQLKSAAKMFYSFRDSVNAALGGIKPKTVPVTITFNGVPEGKITGHTYTSTTGFSYASGGVVPNLGGTDTSDDVPIWASRDEFIVNAKSARKHRNALEWINADRYASGGRVGFSSAIQTDMRLAAQKDISATNTRITADYVKANNAYWAKIAATIGGTIPSGQHLAIINAALAAAGVPPPGTLVQWQAGLNTLVARESGWNPRAVNLWDSNAKAGHPSQGLAQTIPSTFNAYVPSSLRGAGILDPVANLAAAVRYIVARYSNITNVQQANANLPPKGYDSGGWLMPGQHHVVNHTGVPEFVLSPRHLAALKAMQAALRKATRPPAPPSDVFQAPTAAGTWLQTIQDEAAKHHRHRRRRVSTGTGVVVTSSGSAGQGEITLNIYAPVGSQRELKDWLVKALEELKREGRLRTLLGG